MKKETINYSRERVTLTVDDVQELLPDEKFEYQMYRDYRDEISIDTFKECMPVEGRYKNDDGTFKHSSFVGEWEMNLESKIWERNIDWITMQIENELREKVEEALNKKGIEFDELDLDFYPDDLYLIDLNLGDILKRSQVKWNLVWHNNYDGFNEGEIKADGGALEQFLRLFPGAVKEEDLESACTEIYSGSDLKLNFKSNMKDFLSMLASGKVNACGNAVLHLGINGSGSNIFPIDAGEIELEKPYESKFDYWSWEFDGKYGIEKVYGPVGGAFNTY